MEVARGPGAGPSGLEGASIMIVKFSGGSTTMLSTILTLEQAFVSPATNINVIVSLTKSSPAAKIEKVKLLNFNYAMLIGTVVVF